MATHQQITIIIEQLTSLLRGAEFYALHSPSARGRRYASRIARDTHYLLGQANYLYRVIRDDTAFSPSASNPQRRGHRVRITTDSSIANIRPTTTTTEQELLSVVGQVDITEFYNSI